MVSVYILAKKDITRLALQDALSAEPDAFRIGHARTPKDIPDTCHHIIADPEEWKDAPLKVARGKHCIWKGKDGDSRGICNAILLADTLRKYNL